MRRFSLAGLCAVVGALALIAFATTFASSSDTPAQKPLTISPQRAPVEPFDGEPASGVAQLADRVPGVIAVDSATNVDGLDGGTALSVRVAVPGENRSRSLEATRARWKASVLAGAINSKYVATGLPEVRDLNVVLVDPDGHEEPIGGGMGLVVPDQAFARVTNEMIAAIEERCKALGLRQIVIQRVEMIQDVVLIVARADDPKLTVARLRADGNGLIKVLGGSPRNIEGAYLEVDDRLGNAMYIEAVSSRTASSSVWASHELALDLSGGRIPIGVDAGP
jgi:hypothetical protein